MIATVCELSRFEPARIHVARSEWPLSRTQLVCGIGRKRTLEDNPEGALANLLPNAVVAADDVVRRRVVGRHAGLSASGVRRKEGKEERRGGGEGDEEVDPRPGETTKDESDQELYRALSAPADPPAPYILRAQVG